MVRAVPSIERDKVAFLENASTYSQRQLSRSDVRDLVSQLTELLGPDPVANRYRVTRSGKAYLIDPSDIDLGDNAHDWIGRDKGQAFVWATDEADAVARANALRAAGSANKAAFLASL